MIYACQGESEHSEDTFLHCLVLWSPPVWGTQDSKSLFLSLLLSPNMFLLAADGAIAFNIGPSRKLVIQCKGTGAISYSPVSR